MNRLDNTDSSFEILNTYYDNLSSASNSTTTILIERMN